MNVLRLMGLIGALVSVWTSVVYGQVELVVAELADKTDPQAQAVVQFAELVRSRSNGAIQVTMMSYGRASERREREVIAQVQAGTIDIVRVSSTSLTASVPALTVFGLPYLWRSQASRWETLQGEIGQILLKNMETAKLYGLCFYEAGARSFYNNRREIRTVADMQGLKIGVDKDPTLIDLVTALGAIAVPMPFTEVYDGIRKGVIDGAEHDWLHYETRGHYEVARYYSLDRHVHAIDVLIASQIALDQKLTPEQRALVQQAARDTEIYAINQWNEREDVAIQIVTSAGSITTELTLDASAGFSAAVRPLYQTYGGEHKLLIDAILKAQEE